MTEEPRDPTPDLSGDNWHEAYKAICEYYRLALYNALYCGNRLSWTSKLNRAVEAFNAVIAAVVAALIAAKALTEDSHIVVILTTFVAALAAIKPVFRLSDAEERYTRQHRSYRGLYLDYRQLVDYIRVEARVTPETWRRHVALAQRYKDLEEASDPNPSRRVSARLLGDVEKRIPPDSLSIGNA